MTDHHSRMLEPGWSAADEFQSRYERTVNGGRLIVFRAYGGGWAWRAAGQRGITVRFIAGRPYTSRLAAARAALQSAARRPCSGA